MKKVARDDFRPGKLYMVSVDFSLQIIRRGNKQYIEWGAGYTVDADMMKRAWQAFSRKNAAGKDKVGHYYWNAAKTIKDFIAKQGLGS